MGIYYVSTTGNDGTGDGSLGNPWRTISFGAANISGGSTLNIRGGNYQDQNPVIPYTASGTGVGWNFTAPTIIQNYPGEIVTTHYFFVPSPGVGLTTEYIIIRANDVGGVKGLQLVDGTLAIGGGGSGGTVRYIKADGLDIDGPNDVSCVFLGGPGPCGDHLWLTHMRLHDVGNIGSHRYHGVYISGNNCIVEHSEFFNCYGCGIHNYDAGYLPYQNIYRGNYFHECGINTFAVAPAIGLYSGVNNFAYNNLVINNRNGAMGDKGNYLLNNTFYGNGIAYPSLYPVIYVDNSPGWVIQNNIAYGNALDAITNTGGTTDHNLLSDPSFVNPASDYHLLAGSAAISSGVNLSTYFIDDYDGVLRGILYDIGAYEFVHPAGGGAGYAGDWMI